jgi:hypothetical protein
MKEFVVTDDFKNLNVALALDEGLANPTDKFTVFYGERAVWWLKVLPTSFLSRTYGSTEAACLRASRSLRSNPQGRPDTGAASSRTRPWRNSCGRSSSSWPSELSRRHASRRTLGTPSSLCSVYPAKDT